MLLYAQINGLGFYSRTNLIAIGGIRLSIDLFGM
jgi:hypothetical protein